MYLLAGLGNPGKKYERTRHNAGFLVVDAFAKKLGLAFAKRKNALYAKTPEVIILKPETFMNDSGIAVSEALHFFKIPASHAVIIHDDLDIVFGSGKLQKNRSDAGHNGVKSVIERLGTQNFWRMRIGVANEKSDMRPSESYVLNRFSSTELKKLIDDVLPRAVLALAHIIDHGPAHAANAFNKKPQ